jgi:hypothetical protein
VLFPKGDETAAREELAPLYRGIDDEHYLKGQTLRAGGKLLEKSRDASWDDVALFESSRRIIQENVRQFRSHGDLIAKNGVSHRRGLLVYGPPGNGKTLIGRVLATTEPATFLYVTAADADNLAVLREAFALARRLKLTIVFLEDLELYASDRRGTADCQTLGEILAQLDGLSDNDGLMVIATTNDLTAIEPAIRERPSRFDLIVEVGPPTLPPVERSSSGGWPKPIRFRPSCSTKQWPEPMASRALKCKRQPGDSSSKQSSTDRSTLKALPGRRDLTSRRPCLLTPRSSAAESPLPSGG